MNHMAFYAADELNFRQVTYFFQSISKSMSDWIPLVIPTRGNKIQALSDGGTTRVLRHSGDMK